MDAALRLVEQRPAPGPRVLTRRGPARARPAAHRRVPALDERVHRHVVPGDVGLHVGLGPVRQRCDLHLAAAGVEPDDRRVGAGRTLVAAQPGGPCVIVAQRPVQRLHLADRAALVGRAGEQPRTVLGVLPADRQPRLDGLDDHRQRALHRVPHPQGLREVQAGIQEDHFDAWCDGRDEVHQYRVGERARHAEPLAERADRPLHDLLGGGAVEFDRRARRDLPQFPCRVPDRRAHAASSLRCGPA